MHDLMVELLETADIRIDGHRNQDIQIHDRKLADRVFALGNLGLGEAYIEGIGMRANWTASSITCSRLVWIKR